MRVSVFGLGYVGAVSCGCFARDGFHVIGVDVSADKVRALASGRSPIVEEQVGDLIAEGVSSGRLSATTDVAMAVAQSDVSVVSVGTPSQPNGAIDLTAVTRVSEEIGAALASKTTRHTVVVRSTVLPGTVRSVIIPALERASGRACGRDFGVCFNPEFLREGSSVADHYHPPFTLIGADAQDDAAVASALYARVAAPVRVTTLEVAEMVKYVCNAFHALKITFANEVGILAHAMGVDSHAVMDLVCQDTKLNISSKYLTPGFAFGGSCLPKDVRALLHHARQRDVRVDLLASLMSSNRAQIDRAVDMILSTGKKKLALLGLAFKAGTDDLRESPLVTVAETFIGKGFDVRIYDSSISLSKLVGANREYIEKEIPHLSSLLVPDLPTAVAHGEVLVVGNLAPEFSDLPALCAPGQIVVDLVRVGGLAETPGLDYRGLLW